MPNNCPTFDISAMPIMHVVLVWLFVSFRNTLGRVINNTENTAKNIHTASSYLETYMYIHSFHSSNKSLYKHTINIKRNAFNSCSQKSRLHAKCIDVIYYIYFLVAYSAHLHFTYICGRLSHQYSQPSRALVTYVSFFLSFHIKKQ